MTLPAGHPPVVAPRIGVLLVNLGTPDAPTPKAVRRYLKEFLSDPRVVEIPKLVWWPILNGIILNVRPKKSAHAYAQVWGPDGSPLATITKAQSEALQVQLGGAIMVRWAMRYGNPAMGTVMAEMKAAGCERILVAPLYPQYSGATTATVIDELGRQLAGMRWQPSTRTLPPYYDDPLHIAALRDDLARQLRALPFVPEVLLLSFHGMPDRTLHLGDPYHCQCRKTARLVGEALRTDFPDLRIETSFQSRFGRAKWLEPYTEETLTRLATAGVKRLAIAAPGFSADCLETREELAIRGREVFEEAGGLEFAALDCLNTSQAGMAMLEALVRRELGGWI
ncbi:MAG: ferrochelatase [Novosphingobium sp.]